ncbi:hypothetical protein [Alicyclobacillus acidoterrestris]|uniref:Uncharacterized protein n=1 Tax=Alicyclobacillus acidoterrestris (strain ATCC 49025 / DSM 3922 / CIP 106132 / NCIMB 13137 / GD3B) TaxID=1356854 RepID=A0A9E6ZG79_ALIAG|nr:hypothetical protein [Alicyclobacillus acidoterrestris]UNO47808.1 hypothetical protein K1I37_14080 [Alicyclobacillus acidoterrestris]GEO27188.1 hypothetical protein AAC03nite_29730 [Alicyclobacillus acidoterrestris]
MAPFNRRESTCDAFRQTAALKVTLPWVTAEWERTTQMMGQDYWPYGIARNQATLTAAVQYSYEQGLISRLIPMEALFAESTLERFIV